jgi:hypothetical protein
VRYGLFGNGLDCHDRDSAWVEPLGRPKPIDNVFLLSSFSRSIESAIFILDVSLDCLNFVRGSCEHFGRKNISDQFSIH